MPVALITGVMGQDGRWLTDWLLAKGYQVHGTTRNVTSSSDNFAQEKNISVYELKLDQSRGINALVQKLQANEIYHLAARSSSAQLADDPSASAHINGLSVLYFLEAIRNFSQISKFCFASSSEVFAGTDATPQSERSLIAAINPYGIAKYFGMQWVNHYRSEHQLFASSAILYNHESIYRSADYVTRKITSAAAKIYLGTLDSVTLGNLDSQRDWMHASDAVRGLWAMLQAKVADDFVLGSGVLHSVRDVCEIAFSHLGLEYRNHVVSQADALRREEKVQLRADSHKAQTTLQWQPEIGFKQMIQEMVDFDVKQYTANK
jgi:GDPmannose 4,6-dehydratase